MSMLQRFKSVTKSRAKSEIYEISSREEPLFVSHPRQSSFMHFDKIQHNKAKNNEEIRPGQSSEKPLPTVPAPVIPARNPRRGERVQGAAATTGPVSAPGPSPTHATTDAPALVTSCSDTTDYTKPDTYLNTLPANAATLTRLGGALVLRNSLLSFSDLLVDEAVGDVDQLLNAIAKVQTSFAEGQQDWREVSVFAQDDDDGSEIATVGELNGLREHDRHHSQEEDSAMSSTWNSGQIRDPLPKVSFDAPPANNESVSMDLIIEDVSDDSDDLSSRGSSVLEIDISNMHNMIPHRKPTKSVNLDYLMENADEEVTIHLMLDTNILQTTDLSAARTAPHSDPSGGTQPTSAADDSGSSYSIDEYYDSPRAMSDEANREHNAVDMETPRTRYSELIADSPYADKLAAQAEKERNDDNDSKIGGRDHIPAVEELHIKPTTDLLEPLSFTLLETLSPTTYQPPSPKAHNVTPEQQEAEETEKPHLRILSWLSTQPLPSDLLHPDPVSPTTTTTTTTAAAAAAANSPTHDDAHATTSPSSARDSLVPQSFLLKSEEQERFALEAQLEIEDWLTEWTSSLQVSRLYHRALGGWLELRL